MDDRTYGPADGKMSIGGDGPGGAGRGDGPPNRSSDGEFDFAAFQRSLNPESPVAAGLPVIIVGGVFLALTILSFWYGWPLWARLLCLFGLLAASLIPLIDRQPVAPIELTAQERLRVVRVLDEHGARSAVALVRALYPGEPSASATRTVRMLIENSAARPS